MFQGLQRRCVGAAGSEAISQVHAEVMYSLRGYGGNHFGMFAGVELLRMARKELFGALFSSS